MRRPWTLYLLALSFLLGVTAKALAQGPTFTTFDFPGAIATVALDINPAGEIVGRYRTGPDISTSTHGFLRSTSGEFTSVDFPDAVLTVAAAINARGDIVGMYRLGNEPLGVRHGFLLSEGEFTTIDPPGAIFTNVLGINPRGDIVGRYCTTVPCNPPDGGNVHGFLLSEGGEFTTIDFPDPIRTNVLKINPRGQIVGGYAAADGENHVFLLSEGEFTTIDFSGAIAIGLDNGGINPRGDIVGRYCDAAPCTGDTHGFLLSRGEFTTIDFPGARSTSAFGINARGDIVGGYNLGAHGFLLSRRERDEDEDGNIE